MRRGTRDNDNGEENVSLRCVHRRGSRRCRGHRIRRKCDVVPLEDLPTTTDKGQTFFSNLCPRERFLQLSQEIAISMQICCKDPERSLAIMERVKAKSRQNRACWVPWVWSWTSWLRDTSLLYVCISTSGASKTLKKRRLSLRVLSADNRVCEAAGEKDEFFEGRLEPLT